MSFYSAAPSGGASSGSDDPAGLDLSDGGDLNFYSFFGGLLVAEQEDRAAALQSIHEQIVAAAREEKSDRDSDAAAGAGADAAQRPPPDASPNAVPPSQLLSVHLPHILRLALACPLDDIRRGMAALLADLASIDPERYAKYQAAMQFAFQPSSFVPLSSCVDPTGRSEHAPISTASGGDACGETSNLLEDIFLSTGRTSHMDLLMAWHPSYLTVYTGCINHLMEDAGPLPTAWRPYLAIMAAARHQCEYLISFQETEFLLKGGDPTWLKGIAFAPKKLQSLAELNALLAHQPWLLTRHHIATLTGGAEAGTDSWSVAELVHAVVILTTFHALCGFVAGMGIRKEIDAMDWSAWEPSKAAAPAPLQRKATVQPTTTATAAGTEQPAASSTSTTPSLHASTPQQSFQPPSLTPSASASASAKSPLSDGEHLLRLLSSSTGVTDLRGASSGGNGFNAAVEEMGTSPASSSSDAPNRAAPTPTAAATSKPAAEFSLGEGLSGAGVGHAAPTLGSLSNLLRNTHLDANNPATKYVLLDPNASSSGAAATPASSSLSATAAAASARATATMRYVNFDVNSKAYSTFFLHDYSWKEHGSAAHRRTQATSAERCSSTSNSGRVAT